MRGLKITLGAVGAVVVLVLLGGLALPKAYRVERSIEVDAPPEVVFAQVNSLKRWDAWSPWLARDKSIKNHFSGPDAGKGASVSWTSDDSGAGSQTITLSEAPGRVETTLDFGSQGRAKADFSFEPSGSGSRVTWGMQGDASGPLGGYFAMMMEGFIGPDYEDGLARLKAHVEALPKD